MPLFGVLAKDPGARFMQLSTGHDEAAVDRVMALCLGQAREALDEGNVAIGAALVDMQWNIVLADHNRERVPVADRTRHAEMNLLARAATNGLGEGQPGQRLSAYAIVSTAEPCSGCASFAIKTGIRRFYFGASAEGSMDPAIGMDDIARASKHPLIVVGGVRAQECAAIIAEGRERIRRDPGSPNSPV